MALQCAELADVRREARAKRGGLTAKEVIFERWLKNPLLDPRDVAAGFTEVKLTTVYAWFNSWLNGTASPGYPASARGREKEIRAAQKIAHDNGITSNYRRRAASKSKTSPPPTAPEANDLESPSPERVPTTVHRIIRDTELARRVKALHGYKCQICGHTIELRNGTYYAEAHHVQPLGEPHNGPDKIGNIICVCPNHHAELDYGVRRISLSELTVVNGHAVAHLYVDYHNMIIYAQVN